MLWNNCRTSVSFCSLIASVFCHEELACHMLPKEARETCDLGLELTKPGAKRKKKNILFSKFFASVTFVTGRKR